MHAFVAFGVALVLTPLARRAALALGFVDRPGDPLKVHADPVPAVGGLAVVAAWLVATWGTTHAAWGWIAASTLACLALGTADDRRPLAPAVRLVVLAAGGGVLAWGGAAVTPLGPLSPVVVVLLVVGCANAVNILDGQDGLAGGLGAIAALGLSIAGTGGSGSAVAVLGTALAGALAGFLVWNRPPARVFLGNGGAYAVGMVLAVLAADRWSAGGWRGLLVAALCLGVFAFEMAFTVVRRVATGAGLAAGDRQHSYDLLAYEVGRVRTTLLFWSLGAAAVAAAFLVVRIPFPAGVAFTSLVAISAALAGIRLWGRRPSVEPGA